MTPEDERGRRFLLLRKAMGDHFTQTVMGRLIGVTQAAWFQYEQGFRSPTYAHLQKIRGLTGAPPEYLMEGNIKDIGPDLLGRLLKAEKALEIEELRKSKNRRS